MGFKPGETVFMMTGYGPHVWAWGVQYALEKMELPTIPGGGMDAKAASPHVGGYSYPAQQRGTSPAATHLMEDIQVWEVVDPDTRRALPAGQRGLTVCTNLNLESSPQLRFLVGDYTTLSTERCPCGRTNVRAIGSFAGRADDLINLRGIKMFPVQIDEAVRALPGTGDEFEIVLATDDNGLDTMTVRCEHREHTTMGVALGRHLEEEIRSRCEVRISAEVLAPGALPKTEFKARRVKNHRRKTQ
jgi:phenylacetate-CoA ligase